MISRYFIGYIISGFKSVENYVQWMTYENAEKEKRKNCRKWKMTF
jgi:hypothetical protein